MARPSPEDLRERAVGLERSAERDELVAPIWIGPDRLHEGAEPASPRSRERPEGCERLSA